MAQHSGLLGQLGWDSFFQDQLADGEAELSALRVDGVHRARLTGLVGPDQFDIDLPARTDTAEFAVGDWVLADPLTRMLQRRLDRRTLLQRAAEGKRPPQLVAANVDTLSLSPPATETSIWRGSNAIWPLPMMREPILSWF